MASPNTLACNLSDGKAIIGGDAVSIAFTDRFNFAAQQIANIENRVIDVLSAVITQCPEVSSSSGSNSSESYSSSSSSFDCPFNSSSLVEQFSQVYLLAAGSVDVEVVEVMDILESEICGVLNKLVNFEKYAFIQCFSSSSSESSFSSSSSSSSHSSSSSSSSSSFSSSSSSSSSMSSSSSSSGSMSSSSSDIPPEIPSSSDFSSSSSSFSSSSSSSSSSGSISLPDSSSSAP